MADDLDELVLLELQRASALAPWNAVVAGTLDPNVAAERSRSMGVDERTIARARVLFAPLDDAKLIRALREREPECGGYYHDDPELAVFCYLPTGHRSNLHEGKGAVWSRRDDDDCEPARVMVPCTYGGILPGPRVRAPWVTP